MLQDGGFAEAGMEALKNMQGSVSIRFSELAGDSLLTEKREKLRWGNLFLQLVKLL